MHCTFGDHTCVPSARACKNQTAVSHSTEAEVISPDAGLRMDGFREFTLWDIVIGVLEPLVFREGGGSSRQLQPKTPKHLQESISYVFTRL